MLRDGALTGRTKIGGVLWRSRSSPGEPNSTFSTPWGELGIMICYDGDFTDTARTLARHGARFL